MRKIFVISAIASFALSPLALAAGPVPEPTPPQFILPPGDVPVPIGVITQVEIYLAARTPEPVATQLSTAIQTEAQKTPQVCRTK